MLQSHSEDTRYVSDAEATSIMHKLVGEDILQQAEPDTSQKIPMHVYTDICVSVNSWLDGLTALEKQP